MVKEIAGIIDNACESEAVYQAMRGMVVAAGWKGTGIASRVEAAITRYENGSDDDESGSGSYPVGSVVVVTGGEAVSRAKRVLGKAYIVVGHDGNRPVPLGLRGQSEERRTPLNLSDIRPATDAELTAAVNSLNDAQTKMIVCELSEDEPWKSALEAVIRNNGGYCRR